MIGGGGIITIIRNLEYYFNFILINKYQQKLIDIKYSRPGLDKSVKCVCVCVSEKSDCERMKFKDNFNKCKCNRVVVLSAWV